MTHVYLCQELYVITFPLSSFYSLHSGNSIRRLHSTLYILYACCILHCFCILHSIYILHSTFYNLHTYRILHSTFYILCTVHSPFYILDARCEILLTTLAVARTHTWISISFYISILYLCVYVCMCMHTYVYVQHEHTHSIYISSRICTTTNPTDHHLRGVDSQNSWFTIPNRSHLATL